MPLRLTETTPLSEAGTSTSAAGRMRVHAITAGLGSSGYYSPDVLREAATNSLIAQGTPLFLDHASETERHDRPERSVRDIAAVFTGAATYDETDQALVGEIQVFAPYRDLLTEMAPHIGLSISGSATDVSEGEVEGRQVPIIEGLARIDSVDFVTRAGRGGRVVELLESVRANKRAISRGIAEATANETREQLQQALRDAFGGENQWVWVRDFDDSTVWYEHETPDSAGTFGLAYETDADGTVSLSGTPTEVRAATTYVPVARPGSNNPTTEESEEDTMGNISIEESEHRRLTEAAGRVDVLESERDTAIRERDEVRAELTTERRTARAIALVAERARHAEVTFTPLEERGLLADLPTGQDGALDETAFTTTVDEAAAAKKETAGAGTVHGFGGTPVTEASYEDWESDFYGTAKGA